MKENEEVVIDSNASLLIETLEQRWKTYRSELKRCRKKPEEEAIHDLRVATRRLLALVDMLNAVSPHSRLQKVRRTFKRQLDSLDDLRDIQVIRLDVAEKLPQLPELAAFQAYLAKREKRLLKSTAKAIQVFKTTNVKKRLASARKALLKAEVKNDEKKSTLQIVDEAFDATQHRLHCIEPTQPTTIHRTRIAFKKFRYMVEIVHPLIPTFPIDNLKQMHAYQSLMGDIQDLEVFIAFFDKFADKDASYNPEPVRRFYQQRHTQAINTYLEDMQQINIFWRPATESPFPWAEKRSHAEPPETLSEQVEAVKGARE